LRLCIAICRKIWYDIEKGKYLPYESKYANNQEDFMKKILLTLCFIFMFIFNGMSYAQDNISIIEAGETGFTVKGHCSTQNGDVLCCGNSYIYNHSYEVVGREAVLLSCKNLWKPVQLPPTEKKMSVFSSVDEIPGGGFIAVGREFDGLYDGEVRKEHINENGIMSKIDTQGKVVWSTKLESSIKIVESGFNKVIALDNNKALVFCEVTYQGNEFGAELLLVNLMDGSTEWMKKFDINYLPSSSIYKNILSAETSDGNIVIRTDLNKKDNIIKINPLSGEILWSYTFNNGIPVSLTPLPEGGIVIAGLKANDENKTAAITVRRLNSTGTENLKINYDTKDPIESINGLFLNVNNQLVIFANNKNDNDPQNKYYSTIYILNENGNLVNQTLISGFRTFCVTKTPENSFIIGGGNMVTFKYEDIPIDKQNLNSIAKADSVGNLLWLQNLYGDYGFYGVISVDAVRNGEYFILCDYGKVFVHIKDNTFSAADVFVNGEKIDFDVPPKITDGTTLVPARFIFEKLGAKVDWNEQTNTITVNRDKTEIKITIGSNQVNVNDKVATLAVPAEITDGRTLVPLRFISEAFGAKVDWNDETKTINITQ